MLLGAFTVFASLLVALELSTRVLTIFLIGKGFPPLPGQMPLPDYETNLFYILFLVALVMAGGGKYALDNGIWSWAARSPPRPRGGRTMTKRWYELAPVPVRMIVGGGLAYHGYPKIFTADGHASFLYIMKGMGVPFPRCCPG